MSKIIEGNLDAAGLKFGLVVSRFNSFICDRLVEGAVDALVRHGADQDKIAIAKVPGAFEIPMTAKKMAVRVITSTELGEDSIIPALPYIKNKISTAIATAIDDCILNGDTSSTHQDTNVTLAYDHRKAWKGLRYYALNCSTTASYDGGTAAITPEKLMGTRALMVKYGVNPNELASNESFLFCLIENKR